jgi:uridylate kinase
MEPDYLQLRLFDMDEDESQFSGFRRVLLKLSGEALAGELGYGVDETVAKRIAKEIIEAKNDLLVQIAIVVGGGNIWRGAQHPNMDRTTADYNGMLATVMNAKVMKSMLEDMGQDARVMSAVEINKVTEPYIQGRAIRHLEKGRVVILAAGTGNPFFTTDTAAVLRATELGADAVLMAKNGVDGVYSSDPKTNPDAMRFRELEHSQVNEMKLKVMDITATALAEDNKMPIIVFDGLKVGGLEEILTNPSAGTIIR